MMWMVWFSFNLAKVCPSAFRFSRILTYSIALSDPFPSDFGLDLHRSDKNLILEEEYFIYVHMFHSSKKIKLYCFPFAGGSAYSYNTMAPHLADQIELVPVELPGHGPRFQEPLLDSLEAMAADARKQISDHGEGEFGYFGHSLGASIAFLMAKADAENGGPLPLQLIVSGRPAPSIPFRHTDWHTLPSAQFWQNIRNLGGVPDEILENDDLRGMFEPILRSDFKAAVNFQTDKPSQLDVPITMIYGVDDELEEEDVKKWEEETVHPLSVFKFPGNHFYFLDRLPEVGEIISRKLLGRSGRRN